MADYILNKQTFVIHDTERSKEECNLDDIDNKEELTIEEFMELLQDAVVIKVCKHCWS